MSYTWTYLDTILLCMNWLIPLKTQRDHFYSVNTVLFSARSIMSGLGHETQERHGLVRKDSKNDKRSRTHDQNT